MYELRTVMWEGAGAENKGNFVRNMRSAVSRTNKVRTGRYLWTDMRTTQIILDGAASVSGRSEGVPEMKMATSFCYQTARHHNSKHQ